MEIGARIGYAASGLIHLLLAWIALRVAWGGGGTDADQAGALATLAGTTGGAILLWICLAGFALLAVWQVTAAITGSPDGEASDRAKAAAKAVMYAALALTAYKVASGGDASSKEQTQDVTAGLMSAPGGRVLVGLLGAAVVAAGGYHVYKGWASKFLDDLQAHPGDWAVVAGRVGYVAKGVALGIVGVLFVVGALRRSTKDTTGLDGALRTLREQPSGAALLTVVAIGIACYGIYSFARSRYAKV